LDEAGVDIALCKLVISVRANPITDVNSGRHHVVCGRSEGSNGVLGPFVSLSLSQVIGFAEVRV